MATVKTRIGPEDHGRQMTLEEFAEAEGRRGHIYELAEGVITVLDLPGLPHGKVVHNLNRQLFAWDAANPGKIFYQASGDSCAILLPGMQSERHPNLALYLTPPPDPTTPWESWVPDLVAEVVSEGGEKRAYEDKRREYLATGVREYWILDPKRRAVLVLRRTGDVFRERRPRATYGPSLLPGFTLDIPRLFVQTGASSKGEGRPGCSWSSGLPRMPGSEPRQKKLATSSPPGRPACR